MWSLITPPLLLFLLAEPSISKQTKKVATPAPKVASSSAPKKISTPAPGVTPSSASAPAASTKFVQSTAEATFSLESDVPNKKLKVTKIVFTETLTDGTSDDYVLDVATEKVELGNNHLTKKMPEVWASKDKKFDVVDPIGCGQDLVIEGVCGKITLPVDYVAGMTCSWQISPDEPIEFKKENIEV